MFRRNRRFHVCSKINPFNRVSLVLILHWIVWDAHNKLPSNTLFCCFAVLCIVSGISTLLKPNIGKVTLSKMTLRWTELGLFTYIILSTKQTCKANTAFDNTEDISSSYEMPRSDIKQLFRGQRIDFIDALDYVCLFRSEKKSARNNDLRLWILN